MNLYQLCRRFYSIADSQLREIYRTKTFSLNTDLTLSRSVDRRTLKFIKDLVFVPAFKDGQGLGCFREIIPGLALDEKRDNGVECALMPVFRGLRRDSLVSFRCDLACFLSPGCGWILMLISLQMGTRIVHTTANYGAQRIPTQAPEEYRISGTQVYGLAQRPR